MFFLLPCGTSQACFFLLRETGRSGRGLKRLRRNIGFASGGGFSADGATIHSSLLVLIAFFFLPAGRGLGSQQSKQWLREFRLLPQTSAASGRSSFRERTVFWFRWVTSTRSSAKWNE